MQVEFFDDLDRRFLTKLVDGELPRFVVRFPIIRNPCALAEREILLSSLREAASGRASGRVRTAFFAARSARLRAAS
jgi:hypothetical protein